MNRQKYTEGRKQVANLIKLNKGKQNCWNFKIKSKQRQNEQYDK